MNRSIDKILLPIGLLALIASTGFYFLSGNPETAESVPQLEPVGTPYAAIPLPEMTSVEATWPEASEQSTGWIYDVFTPPKIYINLETGEWVSEGWKPPPPPEPFGLYLAELEQARYRIQLLGYIEEDFKDATKSLLLLVDIDSDKNLRVRVGESVEASDFEVIDFSIERIFGEDGSITKRATASIMDLRSGELVELIHGQTLYTEGVAILLRSEEDPTLAWRPESAGSTLENDRGTYRLAVVDLKAATVSIEKTFPASEREAETQTLAVQELGNAAPEEKQNNNSTTAAPDSTVFDSMF